MVIFGLPLDRRNKKISWIFDGHSTTDNLRVLYPNFRISPGNSQNILNINYILIEYSIQIEVLKVRQTSRQVKHQYSAVINHD